MLKRPSDNSFQAVFILSENRVKGNFQIQHSKMAQSTKTNDASSKFLLCHIFIEVSVPKSLWAKFRQTFRIEEQLKNQTEKVAFLKYISSAKKVPE